MKTKLLILTLIVSTLSLYSCKDKEAFREKGVEVEATVVGIKVESKRKKKKTTKKHYLQLSYFVQPTGKTAPAADAAPADKTEKSTADKIKDITASSNGQYVSTEMYITKSRAKKFTAGDKVAIVYMPDDPKEFILKQDLD